MRTELSGLSLISVVLALALAAQPRATAARHDHASPASFGALAPAFVQNRGQTNAAAKFVSNRRDEPR